MREMGKNVVVVHVDPAKFHQIGGVWATHPDGMEVFVVFTNDAEGCAERDEPIDAEVGCYAPRPIEKLHPGVKCLCDKLMEEDDSHSLN